MIAPFISIVIPAYNAEKFILKTLDSVLAQSYKNYELIVVDDGSIDNTSDVVREFLKKHDLRGRCIQQQNKKIAGARNTGILAATGDWIALLDHDDIWFPEKLYEVVKELNINVEVDLICHDEMVTKGGEIQRISKNGPSSNNMYQQLLFVGNCLSPSAVIFRKEVALKCGGFSENADYNTVEDYDFWMKLSRIAKFHFMNRVLGEYVLVDSSASRNIVYHHNNLEIMLRTHLEKYLFGAYGLKNKKMAEKRLATVYRSGLTQLMQRNELPFEQQKLVLKIIKTYPWGLKNIIRLSQWVIKTLMKTFLQRVNF
jgi:glycosyltransferase involved in cell wall biosynthesis